MITNKALSPVIAISLLVIVSVVAVIGFQNWYSSYSSQTFSNVETKDKSQDISIESISENILYIKNTKEANYTLNTIKVGDIDCNIAQNLSLGINAIDISSCLESAGKNEITLIGEGEIIEKKLYVKEIYVPEPTCVNITNGLVGLWHMDDTLHSDDFTNSTLNTNNWIIGNNASIINNKLNLVYQGTTTWGESYVQSDGIWTLRGDFDIQVDFDAHELPQPSVNYTNLRLDIRLLNGGGNSDEYSYIMRRHNSDGTNIIYFRWNSALSYASYTGKMRLKRTGTTLEGFYWNGANWASLGTEVFQTGDVNVKLLANKGPNPDNLKLNVSFDNFIINQGEVIYDSSTQSNNGSLRGLSNIEGKVNNAISFDGIDDTIRVNDDASLDFGSSTDFTISTWINSKGSVNNQGVIVKRNPNSFYLVQMGVTMMFGLYDGVDQVEYTSPITVNNNDWSHVIVTVDRDKNSTMYINGQKSATKDITLIGNINNNNILEIGSANEIITASVHKKFNGSIDEVAIYNKVLNETEISQIYNYNNQGKPICDP